MRTSSRKSVTAFTIESLLDRIACLDPIGFGHQEALEDDYNKKRYSLDNRSKRNSGGSESRSSRHQLSKSRRRVSTPRPSMRGSTKGRLQVCKYTPTVTSTINTASESDATPWSRSKKKSWSSDNNSSENSSSHSGSSGSSSASNSRSSESSESSDESEETDYDDKINLVIQVKRDCEEEQLKQPIKPKRKSEAIGTQVVQTPARTTRKSFFLRSQPKSQSVRSQRSIKSTRDPEANRLKQKELWKGKTVHASRRVGPF